VFNGTFHAGRLTLAVYSGGGLLPGTAIPTKLSRAYVRNAARLDTHVDAADHGAAGS
jgi:hypothetical protein